MCKNCEKLDFTNVIFVKKSEFTNVNFVNYHSLVSGCLRPSWYRQCKHGTGRSCSRPRPKRPFGFARPTREWATNRGLEFRGQSCRWIAGERWKRWPFCRFRIGLEQWRRGLWRWVWWLFVESLKVSRILKYFNYKNWPPVKSKVCLFSAFWRVFPQLQFFQSNQKFVHFQHFDEIFPQFQFTSQIKSLFTFCILTNFSLNFNISVKLKVCLFSAFWRVFPSISIYDFSKHSSLRSL